MDQKYWTVIAKEGSSEADILLYGEIGGFDWNTWEQINMASQFREEFKALEEKYDRINVRINSVGGSVIEGLAISNIISQSKKEVHTYNDGAAMSMAALILLSGHKVFMAQNSLLMIHNAWGFTYGNAQELREFADSLDKYDRSLALMLVDRTGKSEDVIKSDFLNFKDNYYNSDEALDLGLIDEVANYDVEGMPSTKEMKAKGPQQVAAKLLKTQASKDVDREKWIDFVQSRIKSQKTNPNHTPMNFENLKAKLESGAFDKVLTVEEKQNITEEVNAALKEGEVITPSDLADAQAKADKASDELKEAQDTLASICTAVGVESASDVADTVNKLKADHYAAQAKLDELAPPAPAKAGDDPVPNEDPMAELASLPHNKRADNLKESGTIF
jgi:ATP-dependent Clp endopeptidase proteolytic subunit ClpP